MTNPMPQRIQRHRYKGWTKPEGAVIVDRTTKWGNPFKYRTPYGLARVPAIDGSPWEYEGRISAHGTRHDVYHPDGHVTEHWVRYMTREEIIALYRKALLHPTPQLRLWRRRHNWPDITVDLVRAELAGKNLVCPCKPPFPTEPDLCHAALLIEVANTPEESS